MYGNPETTPGGLALKFAASVRIDIRRTETLKANGEVYGNRVKCKVVKNKVAPPFKTAEFEILYGKGINKAGEILDIAIALDIIEKSGSWFSYNGERIGQGKDKVRAALEEDPELMKEIEDRVLSNGDALELLEAQNDILDEEDDDNDGF